MRSFPICNYIKCNFLSFVNMVSTPLASFSLIPLIFELWLFITIHKLWRASTFLDHGWLTNCCNINWFFDQVWSVRAPPYELSFALCVRLSRRERHSQRQKTSKGRYWLLHLLLTLSIHAAQYAQIQHIPFEHFWFTASWSLLLAQSEPEVTLCCSQKNLFRDFCEYLWEGVYIEMMHSHLWLTAGLFWPTPHTYTIAYSVRFWS